MKYYLVGIKGSGMSALAKILIGYGCDVLGCDYNTFYYTQDGLSCEIENINDVILDDDYFYIIGNAFKKHELTKKIIEDNYQYDYYASFISSCFINKKMVCVSGTHGKTTTTSMLACLNPDANYLIGDGNGHANIENDWFIIEGCEYLDSFLNYRPNIALILNIEFDHPDYFKDLNCVINSFQKLCDNSKLVVLNGDCNNTNKLKGNIIRYGISSDNDVIFSYKDGIVNICNEEYSMPVLGIHYAYDFVGAYIVSKLMNVSSLSIELRFTDFIQPNRRMEKVIVDNQIIISDYSHHPTQIKALYESLKCYNDYKKIIIYEPHTYSRTISLMDGYIK